MRFTSFSFRWIGLLLGVSILLLCSCTKASRGGHLESPVYLTDTQRIYLLPPSAMGTPVDGAQRIEAIHNGETSLFEAWVMANDTILSVTLFGSMGATIAEVNYTSDSLFFSSRIMDTEKIKPQYIIADFQLCFYETEKVRKVIEASHLEFEETIQGDESRRIISTEGKKIITIERNKNEIHLTNHLRGYEYRIHSENVGK
jgi:hypothetical protein